MGHSLDLDALTMWRRKAGLSIVGVARAAGLPEATVRAAFNGRPVSDATLAALTKAQSEIQQNPLVRVPSQDEMLQQNIEGARQMVAAMERRQELAKTEPGETPGQRDLRLALAAHSEPVEQMLLRKAEQLEDMAALIAKDSTFTREEITAQLLAARPELMDAYGEVERSRLIAKADARASVQRHQAQQQAAPPKPQQITAKPATDLSDLVGNASAAGYDLMVRAATVAAFKANRVDVASGDVDELLKWYFSIPDGKKWVVSSVQKAENLTREQALARIRKSDPDLYAWVLTEA